MNLPVGCADAEEAFAKQRTHWSSRAKVVATSTRWKYSDKDIEVALEHSDCNGLLWGRWSPCSSYCPDKLTSWHKAGPASGTRSRAAGIQAKLRDGSAASNQRRRARRVIGFAPAHPPRETRHEI